MALKANGTNGADTAGQGWKDVKAVVRVLGLKDAIEEQQKKELLQRPPSAAWQGKLDWAKDLHPSLHRHKGQDHTNWGFMDVGTIWRVKNDIQHWERRAKEHGKEEFDPKEIRREPEHPKYHPHDGCVIPKPADWCDEALLVPHEALRWLFGRWVAAQEELLQNPKSFGKSLVWRVKNLLVFADNFWIPILHHHHVAEDYIYFPFLRTRAEPPLPEALTTEHDELVVLLDKLAVLIDENDRYLRHNTGDVERALSVLQQMHAQCGEMGTLLSEHCDHEEREIPAILRTYFKHYEDEIVTKAVGGSLGWHGMAVLTPLIVHTMREVWLGPKRAEEFVQTQMPLPMRYVYRHCWRPAFYHTVLGLLESVHASFKTDPFPRGVVGFPYGPTDTWLWNHPGSMCNCFDQISACFSGVFHPAPSKSLLKPKPTMHIGGGKKGAPFRHSESLL